MSDGMTKKTYKKGEVVPEQIGYLDGEDQALLVFGCDCTVVWVENDSILMWPAGPGKCFLQYLGSKFNPKLTILPEVTAPEMPTPDDFLKAEQYTVTRLIYNIVMLPLRLIKSLYTELKSKRISIE